MKRTFSVLFCTVFLFQLSAQTGKKITIIHTNDLHSRVTGYAPELVYTPFSLNDDNTIGGFARIAAIIKNEKEKSEDISLVVDAGDFLMGTLFQHLEPETGFQLRLMKKMGYDVVCIGNHEFDFGPGKLAEIIGSAAGRGEIPPVLLSNAVFDAEDPDDDSFESLFNKGIISRKYILSKGGLKIGFFSLMGVEADDNAAFAPPVKFAKQIRTAKKIVDELKKENCDLIICLSHSGVIRDKNGNWAGEDVGLAEKVKGINVIISGHSHTCIREPLIVNGIPVVQTGAYGQNVGKLTLNYNEGVVSVEEHSLIPVDDRIEGDRDVHAIIEDQKNVVAKEILGPMGMEYDRMIVESNFTVECNEQGDVIGSNLGPLVADAIHSYVNKHVRSGTDLSLVAAGVIRDSIIPGFQTAPDIFRIMSMGMGNDKVPGYPLSRVYVTGKELKSILEIFQVAYKSTPAYYIYYSGIKAGYDPEKGMLRKIRRIQIIRPDGKTGDVDFSKKNKTLYAVTANSYILEFVGIIRKMSFGLINVVPKDSSGNPITNMKDAVMDFNDVHEGIQEGKEWLALIEYLSAMKDTNSNGVPDIDVKYKTAVQSFSVVRGR